MINKEELLIFFENINELDNVVSGLYCILKTEDGSNEIKRINFDKNYSEEILNQYSDIAKSYIDDQNLIVKNIDDYDENTGNILYSFTLEQATTEMIFLKDVNWHITESFTVSEINKLKGIIVKIGNQEKFCNIYIPYYPVFTMNRELWSVIFPDNDDQFKLMDSGKMLRFSNNILFIYYKDSIEELFVSFDIEQIEKKYGYDKEFIKKAKSKVDKISTLGFVSDINKITEYIENKKSVRNKINKISDTSPVFLKSIDKISDFVKSKPKLNIFNYDSDGKFIIDSEKKARTFLKVLDDDFLKSELTEGEYDSELKTPM